MVFFEGTMLFVIFSSRNHLRKHKYKYIFYIFFSLKNWHYLLQRTYGENGIQKTTDTYLRSIYSTLNPNQKHPVTTPPCLFPSDTHIAFWDKTGSGTLFIPCFCLMIILLLLFYTSKIWTFIYKKDFRNVDVIFTQHCSQSNEITYYWLLTAMRKKLRNEPVSI